MDFLTVNGNRILNESGKAITLRGVCVPGYMNYEFFINGYLGAEHDLRDTTAEIIGAEKAQYLFDSMTRNFFAEDDARFLADLGVNVIRLPMNYRHFEDDMNPFEYLEEGFHKLFRFLDLCKAHNIYVILDMHSCQGWQSSDWHCDNSSGRSLLWSDKLYQNRFVALWEEIARRCRGRSEIAAYDVMNEPVVNSKRGLTPYAYEPRWAPLNQLNRRVTEAIRKIDDRHIIALEGEFYTNYFSELDAPFTDNLIYSGHRYPAAGMARTPYPGEMNGVYYDAEKLKANVFAEKSFVYTRKHHVPLWIGEFGVGFRDEYETLWHCNVLSDMLKAYNEYGLHWTLWNYKDMGLHGLTVLDKESDYVRLVKKNYDKMMPILNIGAKGIGDDFVKSLNDLAEAISLRLIKPSDGDEGVADVLARCVSGNFYSVLLQPEYAYLFKDMSYSAIDHVMASFAFKNCKVHVQAEIIKKYLAE